MLSGTFQNCPNCLNALDLSGPLYVLENDPLNDIYMCNRCGLIYKPLFNANPSASNSNVYKVSSWSGHESAHTERLTALVNAVKSEVTLGPEDNILDVGAGVGMLHRALAASMPSLPRYFAVEPVYDIASHLKARHPSVLVLNAEFDDVTLPAAAFKAIFVCGVDYLFRDLRSAFLKIARLSAPGGIVVIQRNVFIDQQGYIGSEIADLDSLFSPNPIIRNWFHSDQYREFVSQFFTIRHTSKTVQTFARATGGEYTSCSLTLVCETPSAPPSTTVAGATSYREINTRLLNNLRGFRDDEATTVSLSRHVAV